MTRDEVIALAREAGFEVLPVYDLKTPQFDVFATNVRVMEEVKNLAALIEAKVKADLLAGAVEQPPQEDPDLLAAYLYGVEKGKDLYGSYRVTQNGNCVDSRYTWRPIDDKTPMGVKIQVLTVGGIATHVRLTLNTKSHYTHWTPLPRKP